jgi:two-component system OmpR family sensor kinase
MFRRLSIRWRITLGSVVIALVFFSATLVVVRLEVSSILTSSDQSLARGDLTSYKAEIVKGSNGLLDDSGKATLVFVRNPQGEVQLDTMPRHIRELLEHRRSANEEFIETEDGTDFVVVGEKVVTPGGTWSLWAARSKASSELAMRGFDDVLLIGAAALLVLFGFASWLLGSAALRPVTRMRLQAENLSVAEGADGLPVGEANDEIAALATTLNEFLDRVRRSTAREKQVVSDAAHELRTPLSALKTQLELAHDNFDDPVALAGQVIAAERSVGRLSSLASNLLALSRLEAGETDLEFSTAERLLSELMDSVDRTRLLALAKKVDVAFTSDLLDSSVRFLLSGTSFARIVDNLASNAIAAVPQSGSVTIALVQHERSIELTVGDDGPGMPEEFVARAFDRFSRADESRTGSTGGSGLGLALVKAIVGSAGGSVEITNQKVGLIVTVVLPNM